jgi:hypothetical protein
LVLISVTAAYDELHSLSIELDVHAFAGTYRVMSGSVIVYRDSEIKSASYGIDRPALVTGWLLKDLCRRKLSRESKRTRS